MNIRKKSDYSVMYACIDNVMARDLPQMEIYRAIGQVVSTRSEKGAAVMAAEYIVGRYPDARGFSPRNLRRMRDFYRTYENHPGLLSLAMELGWTQNVVIMEADLTMDLRKWYLRAVRQFGWSKAELIEKIAGKAHEEIVLDIGQEVCDNMNTVRNNSFVKAAVKDTFHSIAFGNQLRRCGGKPKGGRGPYYTLHQRAILCLKERCGKIRKIQIMGWFYEKIYNRICSECLYQF